MKKLFISYKLSKLANKFGFDEPCLAFYKPNKKLLAVDTDLINYRKLSIGNIKAPLYQQIIDWFRVKHNIEISVIYSYTDKGYDYHIINYFNSFEGELDQNIIIGSMDYNKSKPFKTYYKAMNEAIEKTFQILSKSKKEPNK